LHVAVKAGVAAALAWLVVLPLPGVADDYPFYAPLGAVVCVSTTVASTVRAAGQAAAAIFLGAALALAARALDLPAALSLALVVSLGTLIGGWRRIAPMASYVPVSALFVLILGGNDPMHYVLGYLGLTTLGGAIGVAINAAFPSLPLTTTQRSQDFLRRTLADQLDDLADGLEQGKLPTAEQWSERRWAIEPRAREMQQMVADATEARRANWRARRWAGAADRQYQRARALEQVAYLVEDITALVTRTEHAERHEAALGTSLRPPTARALRCTARLLRVIGKPGSHEQFEDAVEAVRRLGEAIIAVRADTDDELFVAGTVVTALRRTLEYLDEETSPHGE
jgi:uncharacterized membrane protein YgaE (UPF0421/DUF939 family)